MYLDMMVDAVSCEGILYRYQYLTDVFGLRLDFKNYHPKKCLKGKSRWYRLLFAALIGPIRDADPFMSASEMDEIRRLTRTPESENRIAWARSRASTSPSEYKPVPVPPRISFINPERQRRDDAMWQANRALWRAQQNGDAQQFEKQLDIMVLTFREYEPQFWYRLFVLCLLWQIRRDFTTRHPDKRVAGRSRWFRLLGELLRGPWCPPKTDWLPDNFFKDWNEDGSISRSPDRQIS